jgi:hypothetical protein
MWPYVTLTLTLTLTLTIILTSALVARRGLRRHAPGHARRRRRRRGPSVSGQRFLFLPIKNGKAARKKAVSDRLYNMYRLLCCVLA